MRRSEKADPVNVAGQAKTKAINRRGFLRQAGYMGLGWGAAFLLAACRQVVQVEKIVERQVTQVVRETVIVEATPRVIEKTVEVEKLVTATPTTKGKVIVSADVLDYGWTRFAMRKTAAFEELFPTVTMHWRSLSDWQEYPHRVRTLQASGLIGDLLECPPGVFLARWATQQTIRALDEIISSEGFDTSGLFSSLLAACRYGGQYLGLPFIGHAGENLLLFNKKVLDADGLTYPSSDWTLDDLARVSLTLAQTRQSNRPQERVSLTQDYNLPAAYPLLHLFGARLISENGQMCALIDKAGIECLRWIQELFYAHGLAAAPAHRAGGGVAILRNGTVGLARQSFRTWTLLSALGERPEIGATLFPKHPTTGRIGTLASGMAYCISQRSKAPVEAFQWIKFMSSREMGVQMFLEGYADPGCRIASWNDARILELYPLCAQIAGVTETANVERLPWNLRLAECFDAWQRGLTPLLQNTSTPEECSAHIAAEINQILRLPLDRNQV